jgi:ubiquinone/menaquinone biosynthesis C-methylase UbiE
VSDGYDPALFERVAELEPRSFWFRSRVSLIVWALGAYFPEARSFLDVGCGTGFVLERLRAELPALQLAGTDLFPEALEHARGRLDSVRLERADARTLPFEREFDVAGAFDVVEHIDDDDAALAELRRVARLGAILLVPQHSWLWSGADEAAGHVRRYSRAQLIAKLERAGFSVVRATSYVTSLLPAVWLARRRRGATTDPLAGLAPRGLNAVLEAALGGERRLLARGVDLPVGTSLLVICRVPA